MLKRLLIGIALAAFAAGPAAAALATPDSAPTASYRSEGCAVYPMCVAQASTGPCDTVGDESGKPIVLRMTTGGIGTKITFYAARSTATGYTCDLTSNDEGYTNSSGDGSVITDAQITNSNRMITLYGPFDALWWSCSAISGGTVTINALVCEGDR